MELVFFFAHVFEVVHASSCSEHITAGETHQLIVITSKLFNDDKNLCFRVHRTRTKEGKNLFSQISCLRILFSPRRKRPNVQDITDVQNLQLS
jgi:hypothetical protein